MRGMLLDIFQDLSLESVENMISNVEVERKAKSKMKKTQGLLQYSQGRVGKLGKLHRLGKAWDAGCFRVHLEPGGGVLARLI